MKTGSTKNVMASVRTRTKRGTMVTRPAAIEVQERRRVALELRKAGLGIREIATRLGVPRSTAWDDIQREIREITREPADQVLVLELERLDALMAGVWASARGGDMQAIDRVIRIMERRAKLMGIDAPNKSEIAGKDGGPIALAEAQNALIDRLSSLADTGGKGKADSEPEPE